MNGPNRLLAAVLAFFLGYLGVHKFYLGKPIQGILHIVLGPIGWIWGLYNGAQYLRLDDEEFTYLYGGGPRALRREKREILKQQMLNKREHLRRENEMQDLLFKQRMQHLKAEGPLNQDQRDEINVWQELYQKGLIDLGELEQKKKEILDR